MIHFTFQAGHNFKGVPVSHIKRLCGVLKDPKGPTLEPIEHVVNLDAIPDEFDSRKKWSNCPTIREIRDQGNCGSCWVKIQWSSDSINILHCTHFHFLCFG